MIADSVGHTIKIGMTGDDADTMPHGCGEKTSDGGIGTKRLQGAKKNRMVGKDKIISALNGRINQCAGGVQSEQHSLHRLARLTDQETDVVPVFSEILRGELMQDVENLLKSNHSLHSKKKKRHIYGDVPLFRHRCRCPLICQPCLPVAA